MPLTIAKNGKIRTNNTTLSESPCGRFVTCTLYRTPIATLDRAERTVSLFTGGYNTPTTHRRMNECLHAWGYTGVRVGKSDFATSTGKVVKL